MIIAKKDAEGAFEALLDDFVVHPYEKAICQGILVPVPNVLAREDSGDRIRRLASERGDGALGASGK